MNKPVIICVDDEKTALNTIQIELLEALGEEYFVEAAESGEEALELFEELSQNGCEIPLIISDYMMPGMSGSELLQCIHLIAPKTFKILLTGISDTTALVDTLNHANLYRYILKPWDRGELILTVYDAVKSYFKDQLLEEQNNALKEVNATLQERTDELSKTLNNLKSTQQELIQTEKLATLGQLVAGIAHEINTPLGAIRSSVENIGQFLDDSLEQLPLFFQSLSEERQQDFFILLKQAIQQKKMLSSKEKRQFRRTLTRQLTEYDIDDTIADTLVEIGIYNDIEIFLPILKDPNNQTILDMAYQLISLQKSTQTINMASNRAAKIVFALKSFARYDQTGKKISADIVEGIETVLTLYHNQLKHGVKLIKNYADNLPSIPCYPDELNQVWTNLVHNSLQAMDNKGTLQIDVTMQDKQILIAVTDSGSGISDEVQAKIFEPFFTTKATGEGSGLGLDIVKKIIDKHDGTITVNSVVGKTTFTVFLPIFDPNNGD
ncbi:ATP-binding protein [Candidatus Halobeggiatoa sp. HSG11]|nr:ATP-binding protein [Candidatus Halobeggiatoa sp. HSG11]